MLKIGIQFFAHHKGGGSTKNGRDSKAKLRVKEEDARITLTLPAQCEEEEAIQAALTGLLLYLCNLREEYPDYIEVLEV